MLNQSQYRRLVARSCLSVAMFALAFPALVNAEDAKEQDRVTESGNALKDLTNASSGIPINVLQKSDCVIILPSVKKAGFIVGASYGRGVMTCRSGANFTGHWSAPTMLQSTGGSFGLQAGGRSTDFVILVVNDKVPGRC